MDSENKTVTLLYVFTNYKSPFGCGTEKLPTMGQPRARRDRYGNSSACQQVAFYTERLAKRPQIDYASSRKNRIVR